MYVHIYWLMTTFPTEWKINKCSKPPTSIYIYTHIYIFNIRVYIYICDIYVCVCVCICVYTSLCVIFHVWLKINE